MAQDYQITAVSPKKNEWESKYGAMVTYYIKVEGNEEPVQLNKKADSSAPKVGDELYGTIKETEYGKKFKGEKKPFSPGGYKDNPEKQAQIKAQFAIKAAIALVTGGKGLLDD